VVSARIVPARSWRRKSKLTVSAVSAGHYRAAEFLLERGSWLGVADTPTGPARRAIPVGFDPPYALPRPRWAPTAQAKKPIGRELLHIMPRPLPGYHADSINEHIL